MAHVAVTVAGSAAVLWEEAKGVAVDEVRLSLELPAKLGHPAHLVVPAKPKMMPPSRLIMIPNPVSLEMPYHDAC